MLTFEAAAAAAAFPAAAAAALPAAAAAAAACDTALQGLGSSVRHDHGQVIDVRTLAQWTADNARSYLAVCRGLSLSLTTDCNTVPTGN